MLKAATIVAMAKDAEAWCSALKTHTFGWQGLPRCVAGTVLTCLGVGACGGGEPDFENCTTVHTQTVCCKTWLSGGGNKARTVCD
jgi:hypothetical protein